MSNQKKEDIKGKSKVKAPFKLIKIDLQKNIRLCLNFGFRTLITAKEEEEYRNAIISIHNGTELLMKYYLHSKNELLIFRKINPHFLLKGRDDLIKDVDSKQAKSHTISYEECLIILELFSNLPIEYKKDLNHLKVLRNKCVHYEYSYDEKKTKKLLSRIYQYIEGMVSELGLELENFILKKHIESMDEFKQSIDDEIEHEYLGKVEAAKKHYFDELTEEEQKQKEITEDYTEGEYGELVQCPACNNNALLRKEKQIIRIPLRTRVVNKRNIVLKDLSCHHCGLIITEYDQLKPHFSEKEKSLRDSISHYDCPDYDDYDCPDYDCSDADCADDDCSDADCADGDCSDADCADGDCP